jgi:hypothetical protein
MMAYDAVEMERITWDLRPRFAGSHAGAACPWAGAPLMVRTVSGSLAAIAQIGISASNKRIRTFNSYARLGRRQHPLPPANPVRSSLIVVSSILAIPIGGDHLTRVPR